MKYLLIILFINSSGDGYTIKDGWHPVGYEDIEVCERHSKNIHRYIDKVMAMDAKVFCINLQE